MREFWKESKYIEKKNTIPEQHRNFERLFFNVFVSIEIEINVSCMLKKVKTI